MTKKEKEQELIELGYTKENHSDRAQFIRRVVLATPSKVPVNKAVKLAKKLLSLGRESKSLAEAVCNRELSPIENKRDDELDLLVKNIGKELGLTAYRQVDPRGNTIRVIVGAKLADNWDGESTGTG